MPRTTLTFGILLILLAVAGYAASGFAAKTALIPAGIGIPLAICGLIAFRGLKARMIAAHVAIVFAALGFLASFMPVFSNLAKLFGDGDANFLAMASGLGMLVLCLVYIVLSIRSFIMARLAKKAMGAVGL